MLRFAADADLRSRCGRAAREVAVRHAGFAANMDRVDRIFHHLVDRSRSLPAAVALPALIGAGSGPA
jgi:hypothetical protein